MAKKQSKGRYHPSRVSGRQKFLRKLDADREAKKVERKLIPLDTKKQDWSN